MRLEFDVQGIPAPKGSTRSFRHRHTGKVVTTNDNERTAPWASAVGWAAKVARKGTPITSEPVEVGAVFRFPRPKAHYRKDGGLKEWAEWQKHVGKPDLDKLLRAILDALTGIAWVDDSQVCALGRSEKRYVLPGESPGASVMVYSVGAAPAEERHE